MPAPRRGQIVMKELLEEWCCLLRAAMTEQPCLGELDPEGSLHRAGGQAIEARLHDRERLGCALTECRRKMQPRRERMILGELEVAHRFLGLAQAVPARERGAHVQIRELAVAVVADEQRLGFTRDEREHVLDELSRVGSLEVLRDLRDLFAIVRVDLRRHDVGLRRLWRNRRARR